MKTKCLFYLVCFDIKKRSLDEDLCLLIKIASQNYIMTLFNVDYFLNYYFILS